MGTYMLSYVKYTASGSVLWVQGAQLGALWPPRVVGWGEGGVQEGGACVHLWLMYADVWQKPA